MFLPVCLNSVISSYDSAFKNLKVSMLIKYKWTSHWSQSEPYYVDAIDTVSIGDLNAMRFLAYDRSLVLLLGFDH